MKTAADQLEPPSPLISGVNPFPSGFKKQKGLFPAKSVIDTSVSFVCHREKILLDEVELRSPSFDRFPFFIIRPFLYFTATDSLKQKKLIFNFFVNRN